MKKILLLSCMLALCSWVPLTLAADTPEDPGWTEGPKPVEKAPAFVLPDLDGYDMPFNYQSCGSGFGGRVTVLMFFASWCSHCQHELPYVQKLYKTYEEDNRVKFLGIRTWRHKETEDFNAFVARMGITFPLVSDTPLENGTHSQVAKLYKLPWVPFLMIIDKTGRVAHVPQIENFDKFPEIMNGLIEPLLQQ